MSEETTPPHSEPRICTPISLADMQAKVQREVEEEILAEPPPPAKVPYTGKKHGPKPKENGKVMVSVKNAQAIFAVRAQKQVGYDVNYKALAPQFGMKPGSLRKLYSNWNLGRIEFPPGVELPGLAESDQKIIKMSRDLSRRDQALCLVMYESCISMVETFMKSPRKKAPDFAKLMKDIAFIRAETKKAIDFRMTVDKGFDSYMEHETRKQMENEKPVGPAQLAPPNALEAARNLLDDSKGTDALKRYKERMAAAIDVPATAQPASQESNVG